LATAALCCKRAELVGEIEALNARLGQLCADPVRRNAAIRILCPDAEPELTRQKALSPPRPG
jgi:hypothetical protein